ncbi:MAG: flagellar biosynthesis anti-sigma factor FlgM [Gammaproteobacteria bacterium]|nr:flagellar biosynthesis anti-sigma factor FlgM [Gammaproteobacteria bacterium]
MDIKNLTPNIASNRATESVKPSGKGGSDSAVTTSSPSADKVTLTPASAQASQLDKMARSVDVDNSARIAELKAAVAEGSYQVDSERVADKLMQTEALFARF